MTKQPRENNGRWASNPFAHNPGRDNTPKAAPAVKKVSEEPLAHGLNLALAIERVNLERANEQRKREKEERKRENEQREEEEREEEERKRFQTQKDCSKYAPLLYSGSLHQEPEQYSPQIQDQLRKEATDASANLETYAEIAYTQNNTYFVRDAGDVLVRKLARVPSHDSPIGYYLWDKMNVIVEKSSDETSAAVDTIIRYKDEFSKDELKYFAEEFAVIGAAPVAKPTFFDKVVREGETFFVAVYEEDGDFFIETTHAQSSETYREMITDANKRSVAEKIVEKADKYYLRRKELRREWEQRKAEWRGASHLTKREREQHRREDAWERRGNAWVEQRGWDGPRPWESEWARNRRWRAEREQRKARRKARRKEIWTRPLFKKSN